MQKIENVASDESNLDAQIEKRREDVERARKRLEALKSVRWESVLHFLIVIIRLCLKCFFAIPSPAFMDEFEKLEQELAYCYDLYILKFRCLVYLEQQLEDIEKSEFDQLRVCNRAICCHTSFLSCLLI